MDEADHQLCEVSSDHVGHGLDVGFLLLHEDRDNIIAAKSFGLFHGKRVHVLHKMEDKQCDLIAT